MLWLGMEITYVLGIDRGSVNWLLISSQVPYKYDLTKFVNVGSISVDHIDPSIFCVLTAKSRDLTAPLADLLTFSPRWDVASRTTALQTGKEIKITN